MIPRTQFFFKYIFILLMSVTLGSHCMAQEKQTRVFGHAPDYKNMVLVFEHYQNYLTYEEEELFSIKVDSTGHFSFSFPLEKTTYAYADLGNFRGFLYLQPGENYQLKLPPFHPVPQAQKLNPFFEPEPISLGIMNRDSTDLNAQIRDFDDDFYYQLDTKAIRIMASKNKKAVETIIDSLEVRYPNNGDPFFESHKLFRYARLRMLSSRNLEKDIIQNYFSKNPVQFNLPAYWDTFKDVFRGFARKTLEKDITPPLSFPKIVRSIREDSVYQRVDLAELLSLWTIYQSYHEQLLSPDRALQLMVQAADSASTENIKTTARNVVRKIGALKPGSPAPDFSLMNFEMETKRLKDFQGKFVYLNFMHTENYTCRRELRLMPRFYEAFGRDLEIVTVLIDENYDNAASFVDESDYQWTFLHFGMNANILNKYNIRAVPQYFLINPEGKLVLSPAPAPGENFHDNFVKQYRAYEREQQRKTPSTRESIFGP